MSWKFCIHFSTIKLKTCFPLWRGFLFYCTYHPWEENLMYLDSILWPFRRTEMLSMEAWRNYWDKKLDRDRDCDIEINVIIWNWIFVATAIAVTLGVWRSHLQICRTHQSLVPSKGLDSFQDGLYVDDNNISIHTWRASVHTGMRWQSWLMKRPNLRWDDSIRESVGGWSARSQGPRGTWWAGTTISGNFHQRSPRNPPKCPMIRISA